MHVTNALKPEHGDLRHQHYNAEVVAVQKQHADLLVMRVRPDSGVTEFSAGQYATLGLGDWEPCVDDVDDGSSLHPVLGKLILRAYSISASMLDDAGKLIRANECDYLEFYVALVRHSGYPHPSLTPRIFHLQPGDRIFCDTRFRGTYTLHEIDPGKNLIFAATGTGEAPHNAMLAELLSREYQGQITSLVCVRYERDLAYLSVHRQLEKRYNNYRYIALTTREPANLDPTVPGYVGKRHLQEFFESGAFEQAVGWPLNPEDCEVFLCGNPAMIGVKSTTRQAEKPPMSKGMMDVLEARGFRADSPRVKGNIHFERYW